MALALVIVRTLVFIAGLALLGQFIVGIFNWGRRQNNFVYQMFEIITRPVVRAVRAVTPRVIVDQHVPVVTFLICLFLYLGLGVWHRDVCLADLRQLGCEKWVEARTQ